MSKKAIGLTEEGIQIAELAAGGNGGGRHYFVRLRRVERSRG